MTQLFIFGLASLFGGIRRDYSSHYSAPKQIFGTALILTSCIPPFRGSKVTI